MRYHKAVLITKPEADSLIKTATSSLSGCLVVEVFEKWYDVRRMTETELNDFVDDLHRAHILDVAGGLFAPH